VTLSQPGHKPGAEDVRVGVEMFTGNCPAVKCPGGTLSGDGTAWKNHPGKNVQAGLQVSLCNGYAVPV